MTGTPAIHGGILTHSDSLPEPKRLKMCNCISHNRPDLGGTNPEVALPYRIYFPESAHETVCVDACIAETLTKLWRAGVQTRGSCCGHNGHFGSPSIYLVKAKEVEKAAAILKSSGREWMISLYV